MVFDFLSLYKKNFFVILISAICLLALFAWQQRFIQDDAFISFRYAHNLITGEGLVWNPNERVEGYTNFLWTLLMGCGLLAGIDPIICAYLFGIIFFIISLIITYKIAQLLFHSRDIAFVVMLLVGLNYTFISFATGGLETQMQTSLLLLGTFLSFQALESNKLTGRSMFYLALVLSLAMLTRLDSGIIVLPLIIMTTTKIFSQNETPSTKYKIFLHLVSPLALIIGSWFIWKLTYYGNILPNTFYIKASGITSPLKGLKYVSTFFFSYLLMPFAILSFFAIQKIIKHKITPLIIISSFIGLWLLYLIKIGGDFMEFRFFVPILPFLFILFGWIIFVFTKKYLYRCILISLILIGSLHHAFTFALDPTQRIEPVSNLHNHLFADNQNWSGIGKALKHFFLHTNNVSIGVTAAGAIPYYSELLSIDMYGLNDHYLAREGSLIGDTPGHQRMSPFEYLIGRGVNLVIAHPMVMKIDEEVKHFPILPSNPNDKLMSTKVIEIPLGSDYKFLALYLIPNSSIDSVIEQNKWKIHLIANK
jgi:arabinofuranosyltransferase